MNTAFLFCSFRYIIVIDSVSYRLMEWQAGLCNHPDRDFADYITKGIQHSSVWDSTTIGPHEIISGRILAPFLREESQMCRSVTWVRSLDEGGTKAGL